MSDSKPEVAEFILCEEIREEINGKVSLMGVYRDELTFLDEGNPWPRPLRHAVYLRIRKLPATNIKLLLSIESGGQVLFDHLGSYDHMPEAPKEEVALRASLVVNVPGYGELITRIRMESDAGEVLEKTRPLRIVPGTLTEGNPAKRSA